jgi:hypothetical protein
LRTTFFCLRENGYYDFFDYEPYPPDFSDPEIHAMLTLRLSKDPAYLAVIIVAAPIEFGRCHPVEPAGAPF